MTSLGRFTVMLSLQAGGLSDTAFDPGDAAINAKLAFNPNTNTLITVPTVPLGNGTYLYTIGKLKAKNGDGLSNPSGTLPIYQAFTLKAMTNQIAAVRALPTSFTLHALRAAKGGRK